MNTGKTLYTEEDLGLDLSNTVSLRQAPSYSEYRPRWRQLYLLKLALPIVRVLGWVVPM